MFQPSSTLKLPKRSLQPLWRYMSIRRFEQLLNDASIHFCPLSSFEDGLEGKLTERTQKRFINWHYQTHGDALDPFAALAQYQEHRKQFLVNCWHMNDAESYLMWKAYAKNGIAIQTTFERARASFEDFSGCVTGGTVDYLEFSRTETTFGNVFTHIVTKDLPYMDERELRFLLWRCDPLNAALGIPEGGYSVRVNTRMLIERIYASPFHPEVLDPLRTILAKHELADRLVDSSLIPGSQRTE